MVGVLRAALIFITIFATPLSAADIAVDVASGRVLTQTAADDLRRPASLTKLMTAFVAFEALEAGEIGEDQRVDVSSVAARQPPVKLGLRPGTRIVFSEVLGAAVVGSKNDAAMVVAEAVAGSEASFVARMNASARALGMRNSKFANPSGLPATGQYTTARDMALLASALLSRFPERSKMFSRRSVRAAGQWIPTTNPLFGRVKGAQGMKTGFTCAAGYSVAALVERDDRRVIAVTLGHPDKNARLRAARGLIAAAFRIPPEGTVLGSADVQKGIPPDIGACSGAPARLIATDISPEERALYAAELTKARKRAAVKKAHTQPVASAPPPLSGWAVFIGAHSSEQAAASKLRAVHRHLGGRGTTRIERRRKDDWTLALIYGLKKREAVAFCRTVSAYCLALAPGHLTNPRAKWRR